MMRALLCASVYLFVSSRQNMMNVFFFCDVSFLSKKRVSKVQGGALFCFSSGDLAKKNNQSSAPLKKHLKKRNKNFQKRSFTFATQNNSFERYFEI